MASGAGVIPAPFGGMSFSQLPSPGQAVQEAREAEALRVWPGSAEWAERHGPWSAPELSFDELIGGEGESWESEAGVTSGSLTAQEWLSDVLR